MKDTTFVSFVVLNTQTSTVCHSLVQFACETLVLCRVAVNDYFDDSFSSEKTLKNAQHNFPKNDVFKLLPLFNKQSKPLKLFIYFKKQQMFDIFALKITEMMNQLS